MQGTIINLAVNVKVDVPWRMVSGGIVLCSILLNLLVKLALLTGLRKSLSVAQIRQLH